jgi:DNA-binding MarR family transcriptional regulator
MYAHIIYLPGRIAVDSMGGMAQSPCVCNTLRMATRAVTQLYDDVLRPSGLRVTQFSILAAIARLGEAGVSQLADALAIDQTTMTRSLTLLERDARIERAPHADARVKSMRLTAGGKRALATARPLWAQAQDIVLRELGTTAWADAQRRLGHLRHIAVEGRVASRRRRGQKTQRLRRS